MQKNSDIKKNVLKIRTSRKKITKKIRNKKFETFYIYFSKELMHTIGVKGGRERRGGGESREKGTFGLGWTSKQTSRRPPARR